MAKHIHKRFTSEQVKDLMKRYDTGAVSRDTIQQMLGIGQTRFFALIKSYRDNPQAFSLQYHRHTPTRRIALRLEKRIIQELKASQHLIRDPAIPIRRHNYSFIRQTLKEKDH